MGALFFTRGKKEPPSQIHLTSEYIMPEFLLPYKYQEEKKDKKMTSYGGLMPLLELCTKIGIFEYADNRLRVRSGDQGWYDSQILLAILSLNFTGGDGVSDINHLEQDEGLGHTISHCEGKIFNKRKLKISSRFRKGRGRHFPSANAIHNYMDKFHDESEEKRRKWYVERSKAFIPRSNDHLIHLSFLLKHTGLFVQKNRPVKSATLDIDGVISRSSKQTAFFTYQNEKGYQPLNAYWHEQGLLLNTEFRDGNVPSNHKVPEFVKASFSYLPDDISLRYLRMDSAGYNFDLMEYCTDERIGFSISVPLCKALKEEVIQVDEKDWSKVSLSREQILKRPGLEADEEESFWQWAELPYVPDDPRGDKYRYIAIRSRIPNQGKLFDEDMETDESRRKEYIKRATRYRLRVIVTNRMGIDGEELFHWHNKRCGYSEQAHAVMKNELAGGRFPSYKFGVNAFWWIMMVIALNITEIYKRMVLGGSWRTRRMKALRFHLINLAGRIEERSRTVIINLRGKDLLDKCRERIESLAWVPI